MGLHVTVYTDAQATRSVPNQLEYQSDVLIPIDQAWSVVTYNPSDGNYYARVVTHPSGGSGAFTAETLIKASVNTGGGPVASGKLDSSTCALLRWRNAVGWAVTLYTVSSSGIGTVGADQGVCPNLSFTGGQDGVLLGLGSGAAAMLFTTGGTGGTIQVASFTYSGTTVSTAANASSLTTGYLASAAVIDSTHLLMFWWDSSSNLKYGVVDVTAGTLGQVGTAITAGTRGQVLSDHQQNLDGHFLHPVASGKFFAAVPSSKWRLFLVDLTGSTINSVTADPNDNTYAVKGTDASSFILNGYWGITDTSSLVPGIQAFAPFDASWQTGTSVGSVSANVGEGFFRSFDSQYRVVTFVGTRVSAPNVEAIEQQIFTAFKWRMGMGGLT